MEFIILRPLNNPTSGPRRPKATTSQLPANKKPVIMAQQPDTFKTPWKISPENDYAKNIACTLCFIGIILNGILLYRFYLTWKNLKIRHIILLSMCVGDFLCSCCLGFSLIFHAMLSELPWEMCQLVGIILATFAATSGVSAFFLSVERYQQIVHSKALSRNQIITIMGFIWLFFPFMSLIPIFTKAYYRKRPCETWCLPPFTGESLNELPFMILAHMLVWSALIGIPFCYWRIYKFALKHGFKWGLQRGAVTAVVGPSVSENTSHTQNGFSTAELKIQSQTLTNPSDERNALHSQLKLTKKLGVLVLQFYVGWFGLALGFTSETVHKTEVSVLADIILGIATIVSWSTNPLIILTMDNQLRLRKPNAK
ncbi:hypothetical protein BKA69DRAFT_1089026 [Paraphysoderma sedebokerense]|nr:hypothetical protein BKA69DRAFT_1089026 [Paraphysoderma sedebokerense]